MSNDLPGTIATVALLIGGLTTAGVGAAPDAEATVYQTLVTQQAPCVVTVKFVLEIKAGGEAQERESESPGVMIDAKGLVLCSNARMGGIRGVNAKPTDMKILIGDDTEGLEAEFVARDSELDLAWLAIKDPGERKFKFLDLKAGAPIALGQKLLAVRRMGKYFDRAPVVAEGRVTGVTVKPRKLLVPTPTLAQAIGLPVFNGAGKLVGFSSFQLPDPEDMGEGLNALLGGRSGLEDISSGLILPAAEVAKATARALQSVEDEDEDGAGEDEGEGKEEGVRE